MLRQQCLAMPDNVMPDNVMPGKEMPDNMPGNYAALPAISRGVPIVDAGTRELLCPAYRFTG